MLLTLGSDLELLPRDEGELLQLSLLWTPLVVDEAVPDDHPATCLVESRVEVERDVTGCTEIQSNSENQQRCL